MDKSPALPAQPAPRPTWCAGCSLSSGATCWAQWTLRRSSRFTTDSTWGPRAGGSPNEGPRREDGGSESCES